MKGLTVTLSVVASMLTLGGGAAIAGRETPRGAPTRSFEFRPGVIVDPDRRVAYLMRPSRGVQAIEVTTGRVAWASEEGDKPLVAVDGRVVAQAEVPDRSEVLRIVILRADDGKKILQADAALPEPVRAAIDDAPGASFKTTARERDGQVVVSWVFTTRALTGMDPGVSGTSQVDGLVRVDVRTGHLDSLSRDAARDQEDRLSAGVRRAMAAGKIPNAPWRAGALLATTVRVRDGADRTVLKRWRADTGDALEDVALFRGEERWTVRYPSADGQHLLISRPTGAADGTYTWRIFSLETGRHIGDVDAGGPGARFFVSDALLIHEVRPSGPVIGGRLLVGQPLRLRAVRLADGTEVWSQPIRDTATYERYPPATQNPRAADPRDSPTIPR